MHSGLEYEAPGANSEIFWNWHGGFRRFPALEIRICRIPGPAVKVLEDMGTPCCSHRSFSDLKTLNKPEIFAVAVLRRKLVALPGKFPQALRLSDAVVDQKSGHPTPGHFCQGRQRD